MHCRRWYKLDENLRYPCRTSAGSSICISNNVSTADHKVGAHVLPCLPSFLLQLHITVTITITPEPNSMFNSMFISAGPCPRNQRQNYCAVEERQQLPPLLRVSVLRLQPPPPRSRRHYRLLQWRQWEWIRQDQRHHLSAASNSIGTFWESVCLVYSTIRSSRIVPIDMLLS